MANYCEIAGSFESQINQTFFNTKGQKGQRVKGLFLLTFFDPLSLCPFVLKLLSNFRSL